MRRVAIAFMLMMIALAASAETRPAVARMWRGRVPRTRADEYQKYLDEAGIQKLRAIKNNLGVDVFRRDEGDATEFLVISYWPNRDAIHAYAGADIEKVHELPRDREFLIDAPGTLKHYDVIYSPPPPVAQGWKNADPAVDCAGASDKALCAQLLAMRDRDQQARHAVNGKDDTPEIRKIDTENLAQLDAIVAAHGFPTKATVGIKGVGSAWTIVQHNDLATHIRYQPMLEKAMQAGDLEPALYATFYDRVMTAQNKPQLYGTQFHEVNGELVPFPIEDEAHVEERRAKMGMQPLAEYARLLREMFKKK
jgi:heme-degrading monooxygenase HmoA